MKTSNYIVIAFFTCIIGGILVLFIAARGHENDYHPGVMEMTLSSNDAAGLANFSVIVAESNTQFTIEQSDSCRLTFYYPEKEDEPKNPYRISGDTLYFLDTGNLVSVNLYLNVSKQLSSLVAKEGSRINLRNLNLDSLSVFAQDANVLFNDTHIENFLLQANNTRVDLYSHTINQISAKLENNATLYISGNIDKVVIEKDSTSNYSLY
ncbi:hypothetical protein AGMMS50239_18740 [Bacteroidia bacterium]|nr:hypothetical protein AGMMS50239_18740 [Bacteroidia bacterium]